MKSWREECAVFGVWNDPEAAHMTYLGLYALQHRGQEAAGIVSLNAEGVQIQHKGLGLVGDVFTEETLVKLKGTAAIGHTRYSTTGENHLSNAQPLAVQLANGPVAIAHNGNIVNAHVVRSQLQSKGSIFQGTNDTECVLHLLAKYPSSDIIECLKAVLSELQGAYSMVLLTHDRLVAMRDPYGFRPLVIGQRPLEDGGHSWVVASETCAFDLIGAKFVREVNPGEIFWVDATGEHSVWAAPAKVPLARCIFEHVYFARPDSSVFGQSVYDARKRLGAALALESGVAADLVVPVPDSGVPAAIGYSAESGIPFELGIIRNHYIGRTFIQPSQSIRSFGVKIKLNPQTEILKGKSVIVIDDSLVRGTTSQKIIRLIRQAGAQEVHFRIASPPTVSPCYYGVDTPEKNQLIAANQTVEEIRKFIDADSLAYLSKEGMLKAIAKGEKQKAVAARDKKEVKSGYCTACFSGRYPTDLFGLGNL